MKKRKHKRQRAAKPTLTPQGYDFGTPVTSAVITSPDFIRYLVDANIIACAYGMNYCEKVRASLPLITLAGTNEDGLKKVSEEFRRWGAEEDGDVIQLTFVLLKGGRYGVTLEPSFKEALIRLVGLDRATEPFLFFGSWNKRFDTRHVAVQQLKDYKQNVMSPILLSFAHYAGPADPATADLQRVKPVMGLADLLKFDLKFVDEAEPFEQTETAALPFQPASVKTSALKRQRVLAERDVRRQATDPVQYSSRRRSTLNQHFPMTLERVRRAEQTNPRITDALQPNGIQGWQLQQAVCNLILSRSICNGQFFYAAIQPSALRDTVLNSIRDRIELADESKEVPGLRVEQIVEQVRLDAVYLLRQIGARPSKLDLDYVQQRLKSNHFLDNDAG